MSKRDFMAQNGLFGGHGKGAVPPVRKQTLRITGNGTSGGGHFQRVRITGEAIILGDLESESFRCTGTARIQGGAQARSFRVQGETVIEGLLQAEELSVMGQMKTGGFLTRRAKLRGQLESLGSCEGGQLTLKGGFDVAGRLSAERMEITLYAPSMAAGLHGGTIEVRRSRLLELKQLFSDSKKACLMAESIEGTELYLEYTTASVVRGGKVTIGPGCKIGLVEYWHSISVSKHAEVGQQMKV
ncbi:cytoskeletal protein CcmA (bactofilin family) [Paenibacillus phyllosphaerae]|uniref:Cytoskeletal protein CcmA (Bactofilin family) n=1 Tax=Paenibacillus phyllosphaerae TaxID=274593 RepID=A0A7W5FP91_9BACL|nr:hypothetical protein [Paenibacillus phyllosphaerae]MBB3112105.1 cytoskeletal protein CcmA (bactofilin family) [Paenibacillus phyllosphaerae]